MYFAGISGLQLSITSNSDCTDQADASPWALHVVLDPDKRSRIRAKGRTALHSTVRTIGRGRWNRWNPWMLLARAAANGIAEKHQSPRKEPVGRTRTERRQSDVPDKEQD